jgi:hypothetical protein
MRIYLSLKELLVHGSEKYSMVRFTGIKTVEDSL